MIALDTSILIRFLVRDDEKQAQIAYARFKKAEASHETFFVPLLVEGKKSHTDLADLLIALTAQSCGCAGGITFDKKAAKLAFFRLAGS